MRERSRELDRNSAIAQERDDPLRASLDCFGRAIDDAFGVQRLLVWITYTGEVLDLAGKGFLIESLDVAFDQHVQRTLHEDFDEPYAVTFDGGTNIVARLPVRRDGRGEHYHTIARQQPRDETDTTNIGVAILFRKPETPAQILANLIAVQ